MTAAPDEPAFMSAAELVARYRRKDISPVEVVRAVFERIDRHNSAVNAFCHLDREGALKAAKESEVRWLSDAPLGLARVALRQRKASGLAGRSKETPSTS